MAGTKNSSTPGSNGKFTGLLATGRPLGFGRIYRDDIDDDVFRRLENSHKVIYFTLLSYTDAQEVGFPSQVTLARMTGFNRVTINTALAVLKAHKFLREVGRSQGGVVHWQVGHRHRS